MKRETLTMADCEYCGGSGEVYDVSNNRPRSCPLCGDLEVATEGVYSFPQISVRAADHGDLRRDLAQVLNRHSRENGSNTPDWILAQYLANCLDAYDVAIGARAQWYGRVDSIAGPQIVPRPIDTYTGADGKQHPIVEL